jgi:hypothetical protein
MIVTLLKLPLEQSEYSALLKSAENELRSVSGQGRFILRQELTRRGLLSYSPLAELGAQKCAPEKVQDAEPTN